MAIYHKSGKFQEYKFKKEEDFEKEVVNNYKLFFGEKTIYIDAKKKMETKIGNVIPDGFLFDLTNIDDPEFYIVEVELSKHSFYEHIFPQITKFIGFINSQNYDTLITKIWEEVQSDKILKKQFGETKELYKFIKDTMANNCNILLVIDDLKQELNEMNSVYQEWNRLVKQICIKKHINKNETMYDITPEFKDIEDTYLSEDVELQQTNEDFHLANKSDVVKCIYSKLKAKLLADNPNLIFNPQKYYISIKANNNFAFLKFRKKKIKIVINMTYDKVKALVKNNIVQELSESVQKFYFHKPNSCCAIVVSDVNYIDEVIELLKQLY
ncbi:TPA: hypothetical protein CPT85_07035 [Candidatus Gastranaerophilales bacterium HUM_21]|nr:MAG TPA: hypothetical protein CPT85_07035 [Candidatus Gastranaerophilales bacterium HUM_21]